MNPHTVGVSVFSAISDTFSHTRPSRKPAAKKRIQDILDEERGRDSMKRAMGETERRRAKQIAHNREKGIEPRAIVKQVKDLIDGVYSEKAGRDAQRLENEALQRARVQELSEKDLAKEIKRLEKQMLEHARNLEFEQAAQARDALSLLKARVFGADAHDA